MRAHIIYTILAFSIAACGPSGGSTEMTQMPGGGGGGGGGDFVPQNLRVQSDTATVAGGNSYSFTAGLAQDGTPSYVATMSPGAGTLIPLGNSGTATLTGTYNLIAVQTTNVTTDASGALTALVGGNATRVTEAPLTLTLDMGAKTLTGTDGNLTVNGNVDLVSGLSGSVMYAPIDGTTRSGRLYSPLVSSTEITGAFNSDFTGTTGASGYAGGFHVTK